MDFEKKIEELEYQYGLQGKYDEENQEDYSNGYILDNMLEILEDLNPTLRKLIIDTDGDELTDAEAIEMIVTYFRLNKNISIEAKKEVEVFIGLVETDHFAYADAFFTKEEVENFILKYAPNYSSVEDLQKAISADIDGVLSEHTGENIMEFHIDSKIVPMPQTSANIDNYIQDQEATLGASHPSTLK